MKIPGLCRGKSIATDHEWVAVDSEISEINEALADAPTMIDVPTMINENPESDAWIYRIRIADAERLGELTDLDAYRALIR